jgi:hypothetical protein
VLAATLCYEYRRQAPPPDGRRDLLNAKLFTAAELEVDDRTDYEQVILIGRKRKEIDGDDLAPAASQLRKPR